MSQTGKVLLAFTGIFVAGAVAGGIVALRLGVDRVAEQTQTAAPAPVTNKAAVTVDAFSPQMLERFTRQLILSADQRDKIKPIITLTGQKLQKLSAESATTTNALLEDMDKQVEALLDPGQRKKLADFEKQRQENFNKRKNGPPSNFGSRRGGGPGGDNHPGGSTGTNSEPTRTFRRGGPSDDKPSPSPMPAPADQPPVA